MDTSQSRADRDVVSNRTPASMNLAAPRPRARLGFRVFKNTTAQIVGRNLVALARLAVASIIVRNYGAALFGEYALVFGILAVVEWVVDFGTTEIAVREISREPEKAPQLLRVMAVAKLIQVPVAYGILVGTLLLLDYPAEIVRAGLAGGLGLFFFAGILFYRAQYKATLTMERELGSELISVVVMIPLVATAASFGWGLTGLLLCHSLSRAVFFAFSYFLGSDFPRPSISRDGLAKATSLLSTAAAIGGIGLLVAVYEALDLLLLSKLAAPEQLGYYSSAQRLVWPMLMALASVGTTIYPIAAACWPSDRLGFKQTIQRGLDSVVALSGLAFSAVVAGAPFLLGLLSPELVSRGTPVLRVLAVLCFVKAITSTLGPILYVVNAQARALQFIAVAVAAKLATLLVLAPRFGALGVAAGAGAVELAFATIPSVYLVRKLTGARLQWGVPLRVVSVSVLSIVVAVTAAPTSPFLSFVGAPALYVPLVFAIGAVRMEDVLRLLDRGGR